MVAGIDVFVDDCIGAFEVEGVDFREADFKRSVRSSRCERRRSFDLAVLSIAYICSAVFEDELAFHRVLTTGQQIGVGDRAANRCR